jgi:hypothetical protein
MLKIRKKKKKKRLKKERNWRIIIVVKILLKSLKSPKETKKDRVKLRRKRIINGKIERIIKTKIKIKHKMLKEMQK